ncbi:MAG: hypothetical protein L0H29_11130, partial [Sinobacteraceae bacterium]|nr:hypothetical protein [Nevskiaceae bacterium]
MNNPTMNNPAAARGLHQPVAWLALLLAVACLAWAQGAWAQGTGKADAAAQKPPPMYCRFTP